MKDKGFKLAQEIIDIMEDQEVKKSIDHYPELREAIETNEYSNQLIENLTNAHHIKQSIAACGNREESSARFTKKINDQKRKKHQHKVRLTISSTAAAFIAISFFIYDSEHPKNSINETVASSVNGDPKPVIVYDNGERINLEDQNIKVGNLQVEGNSLTYSATEDVIPFTPTNKSNYYKKTHTSEHRYRQHF